MYHTVYPAACWHPAPDQDLTSCSPLLHLVVLSLGTSHGVMLIHYPSFNAIFPTNSYLEFILADATATASKSLKAPLLFAIQVSPSNSCFSFFGFEKVPFPCLKRAWNFLKRDRNGMMHPQPNSPLATGSQELQGYTKQMQLAEIRRCCNIYLSGSCLGQLPKAPSLSQQ